jgi:hypothetical protein
MVAPRWKSRGAVGANADLDFARSDVEDRPRRGRGRRAITIAGAAAVCGLMLWAYVYEPVPDVVHWCGREWQRSSGDARVSIPDDPGAGPWRPVDVEGVRFHVRLDRSAGQGCPEFTPTVGYAEVDKKFYVYELNGGP